MRMYRRLIVSIATAAAVLAATPAFGQSFKPDSTAFGPSVQPITNPQQTTTPPPAMQQRQQPNTGLGFGIHFGGTWTSISTDENLGDIDLNKGSGIVAGIFFGGNRDGRAGLQGEVSYLTKKINVKTANGPEGTLDQDSKNTYIQIPILLRINTGSRSNNGPCLFFLVGPAFDIKISETDDFTDLFDTEDVYQGLETGLMVGAGFEVARFGVQVRYTWGLTNVLSTDAADEAGFKDTKYNSLQITGIFRIN
jgi:hypothetical protein